MTTSPPTWTEEMLKKSEEDLLYAMGVTKPKYVIGVKYPITEIDDKDKGFKDEPGIY